MISISRVKSKAQAILTLESSAGWVPAGRSRDRPMEAEQALKISAFYRAVDLRSDSIGRLPVTVKDLSTRRECCGHYLGKVLWERPNEAMGPFVYKKLLEYQRLVLGKAYVWIVRGRDGRPVELLPLPPGACHPYIEPGSGKLWYIATNPNTGEPYRLAPEDVLHYKGFSTNGVDSLSLLAYAARTLAVAESRDEYERDFYANGARPSGILETGTDLSRIPSVTTGDGEQLSAKDVVRREWERIHSGPGNAMRVAVLDNGLKYTPISISNSDMQFIEAKAASVEDIARFTGVPLHMLSAGKQSYESNSANTLDYVKYTLQPCVVQYEEEDSRKLLTASERARGLWLPRNMMAELRGDSESRRDWYAKMREIGAMSVNEIRALEDMPPCPGGDSLYASTNYVPLEEWPELSRLRAAGGKAREQ